MKGSAESVGAELLPCPFCGGKAHMAREHDVDGMVWIGVECKCGAKSRKQWFSPGNDCPQTYAESREQWNTRARPSAAARADGGERDGLVARLRAESDGDSTELSTGRLLREAADAIEARDRTIAELQHELLPEIDTRLLLAKMRERARLAEADAARKEKALAEAERDAARMRELFGRWWLNQIDNSHYFNLMVRDDKTLADQITAALNPGTGEGTK